MPSENVAGLQRAFEAFAKGDMETVSQFIDPNFEVEDRIIPEPSPSERGIGALVANAEQVRQVLGEVSYEPREVLDLGDYILVQVRFKGSGRHTSLPVDEDIGHMYTLKDGKAIRLDIFRTWAEARRAAGLAD
jgi:ketosteroid isomerase-like protein